MDTINKYYSDDDTDTNVTSESEFEDDYKKGGYCPVKLNKIYNNKYLIEKKIGWGYFSTVWLGTDTSSDSNNKVALKFQKSASIHTDIALDEIEFLSKLPKSQFIVEYLDNFTQLSDNGKHIVIVFKPEGNNLLHFIKKYKFKGLSFEFVQKVAHNMLSALIEIQKVNIIHTDIKPENIMISYEGQLLNKSLKKNEYKKLHANSSRKLLNDEDNILLEKCHFVLIDFGNACTTDKHFTNDVTTLQYRAPEVIIGNNYDMSIDIYSLACVLFELLVGDYLFDPKKNDRYSKEDDHLALMIELLGPCPKNIYSTKPAKKFFNKFGQLKNIENLDIWPMQDVLKEKYNFKDRDIKMITDFLLPMLDWDPKKRLIANNETLNHEWLQFKYNNDEYYIPDNNIHYEEDFEITSFI